MAKFIDWPPIQVNTLPMPQPNGRSRRANLLIATAAIALFTAGVALSHRLEPGVRIEKLTLAGDTPAIRLFPASPGHHPIALLVHGWTGSKETLFRYGEALAAAGFDCYTIDLPGHGASPRPFSLHNVLLAPGEIARTLGPLDVFLGHSMGAAAGAASVRNGTLLPRLFIAVGNDPTLGEHAPPLLLLEGRFEEFVPLDRLKARTDARVVISPWSDHLLELLDPCLVNAAVDAACATVGITPPAPPTAWLWRLAGLVLGMTGALLLVIFMPVLPPRFAWARGFLVAAIVNLAIVLTMGTRFDCAPHLHRIPLQLALMIVLWLALVGVGKLHLPRWSIAAVAAVLAVGCRIVSGSMLANMKLGGVALRLLSIVLGIPAVLLFEGAILGWITARRGSRRDGDIAMAIYVGYAVGQWIPKFF
ncbi:MAG TPA: alpha/beta fold hydrolase [Verrucomicrobiae bacterium]|nr:alpha/beta fold hydrolase [Verrucomicrobiae bacterium]